MNYTCVGELTYVKATTTKKKSKLLDRITLEGKEIF